MSEGQREAKQKEQKHGPPPSGTVFPQTAAVNGGSNELKSGLSAQPRDGAAALLSAAVPTNSSGNSSTPVAPNSASNPAPSTGAGTQRHHRVCRRRVGPGAASTRREPGAAPTSSANGAGASSAPAPASNSAAPAAASSVFEFSGPGTGATAPPAGSARVIRNFRRPAQSGSAGGSAVPARAPFRARHRSSANSGNSNSANSANSQAQG